MYLLDDIPKYAFTHAIYYSKNVVSLGKFFVGIFDMAHAEAFRLPEKINTLVKNMVNSAQKISSILLFTIHFSWLIIFSWIFFTLSNNESSLFWKVDRLKGIKNSKMLHLNQCYFHCVWNFTKLVSWKIYEYDRTIWLEAYLDTNI